MEDSIDKLETTTFPFHIRHSSHYTHLHHHGDHLLPEMTSTSRTTEELSTFTQNATRMLILSQQSSGFIPSASLSPAEERISHLYRLAEEDPRAVLDLNLSSAELEVLFNFTRSFREQDSDDGSHRGTLYSTSVPVMLFFCALTLIVNLVIVLSARWCRKPMSPTLYFSISLALADAYASLVLGTGLLINSFLPVYGIGLGEYCFQLTLEAFR